VTIFADFYRLDHYEEARGLLETLEEHDGSLVAKIGKVKIIIPQTFEQSLRPLVGRWISILRTDLPQKSYLFRDLASETPGRAKN